MVTRDPFNMGMKKRKYSKGKDRNKSNQNHNNHQLRSSKQKERKGAKTTAITTSRIAVGVASWRNNTFYRFTMNKVTLLSPIRSDKTEQLHSSSSARRSSPISR
jgi:hypothetical protein